jgi:peptidoglycan/LPS O-acetylase OafA/YrhL
MTANTTFTAPTARPMAAQPTSTWPTARKWMLKRGAVAGVSASFATFAVAAAARGLDVPLTVSGKAIPLLGFAQLTFVAAMVGTAIAAVLSHRAARPRHTFVITTIALTLVSIVPDVIADAHTATKIVLALTHVVAAVIVIPALAARLAD